MSSFFALEAQAEWREWALANNPMQAREVRAKALFPPALRVSARAGPWPSPTRDKAKSQRRNPKKNYARLHDDDEL